MIVHELLFRRATVDLDTALGETALMFAAKGGHELAMLPLLRRPEALHRVDKMKREAIAYATTRSVARRLLEAGAKVNQRHTNQTATPHNPLRRSPPFCAPR